MVSVARFELPILLPRQVGTTRLLHADDDLPGRTRTCMPSRHHSESAIARSTISASTTVSGSGR